MTGLASSLVAATGGRRRQRRPHRDLAAVLPWAVPVLILLVWQGGASLGWISADLLPSPWAVIQAAIRLGSNGELFRHVQVSFGRAATGLLIGGGIGFALGLANGLSRLAERTTDTTLQMIRNIPHLALIPLVILWFGIDEAAKIFLVALGTFFPIYINTLHGIRTVDPALIEMTRSYGFSRAQLFWQVLLPGSLPSIFVGLRYALGIMWLTLIVAETIAAQSGLGYMAMQAREFMLIDVVVLAIVIYALLGKLADVTARLLERLSLSWHPAFQGR